jgi:prophage DNA circulation protein
MDNPSVAFAAVTDNFLGIDGLTADTMAKYFVLKGMLDFGETGSDTDKNVVSPNRIDPSPTTLEEAQLKQNADVLQINIQTQATIESMRQVGNTEYDTVEDVDKVVNELETQFVKLSEILTDPGPTNIYTNALQTPSWGSTYDGLKDLRDAVYSSLDDQRLNLPYIQTINVPRLPASVLAHLLYGDSTRRDQIMDINGLTDPFILEGPIQVLSE